MEDSVKDDIKEYGVTVISGANPDKKIWVVSVIGEIEGHEEAGEKTKSTKYEHLFPILTRLEDDESVEGVMFIINTVGGDVSCGLAIAEMIASLSKPTASLIVGDSHSIGVPISVAADVTVIARSATVIIHPVRMSGPVLGAPQTCEYFKLIQDRIVSFIAEHTEVDKKQLNEWMVAPGILNRDLGTIFVGNEAVDAGIYQMTGGIHDTINALKTKIKLEQSN